MRMIFVACLLVMLPLAAMAKESAKKAQDKPVTVTGVLGAKAAGAAESVLAQLTDVKAAGKTKDAPAGPLDLTGNTDALTAKIKELLAKNAKVTVSGTITGTTMAVTEIDEQSAKKDKKTK